MSYSEDFRLERSRARILPLRSFNDARMPVPGEDFYRISQRTLKLRDLLYYRKETAMSPKIKSILIWGLVIALFILGTPLLQMAF
jgi:hypothetical protein